jgi:putative salt-induced outer membrane protein YdiY
MKVGTIIQNGSGYIGLGAFYENVKYLDDLQDKNLVLNNYMTYEIKFTKETTLAYRLDFQPVYNEFDDYILIQKLSLNVALYEGLSLQVTMAQDVDSHPAEGVDKNNFTQVTGLVYKF